MSAFTFHNVSINTFDFKSLTSDRTDLHSTMFLLIRQDTAGKELLQIYLHSTMFLLIHFIGAKNLWQTEVFTFHNVSINTD